MSFWLIAISSGFAIGLIGNIHCIAMCGPLALSLPIQGYSNLKKMALITYYNLGRACSYTILGLIFGLIGNSFSLFGLQQTLSIVAGIVLLLLSFTHFFSNTNVKIIQQYKHVVQKLLFQKLQHQSSATSFVTIGFLNGLLPCGLVYIAITTALAMGNVFYSMLVMFSFGVGTFPLMLSLMLFGNNIPVGLRLKLKKITPIFVSIIACLLIIRGLNLNIPFVSPYMQGEAKINSVSCH